MTYGFRGVLSGAWVDASPGSWPGMFQADTPEDARAVVEQIAAEGWAAVKANSMLDEATYRALAEAAETHDLPLVGHIPGRVALGTAIEAGQDGMEHFARIPMACSTAEGRMLDGLRAAMSNGADLATVFGIMAARNHIVLETWDDTLCRDVLAQMATADLHVSPTLVVADFYIGNWPAPDTPQMQMMPAAVREAWGRPDFRLEAMTFANPYLFHGFSLLDELDIYVGAGLTPGEALYTATVAPPRFFGLSDQDGTIAVGRSANLVLLDANSLDGLETLRRPRAVIAGGHVLDRAALDEMEARLLEAGE